MASTDPYNSYSISSSDSDSYYDSDYDSDSDSDYDSRISHRLIKDPDNTRSQMGGRTVRRVAPPICSKTTIAILIVWAAFTALIVGLAAGQIGLPYTAFVGAISGAMEVLFIPFLIVWCRAESRRRTNYDIANPPGRRPPAPSQDRPIGRGRPSQRSQRPPAADPRGKEKAKGSGSHDGLFGTEDDWEIRTDKPQPILPERLLQVPPIRERGRGVFYNLVEAEKGVRVSISDHIGLEVQGWKELPYMTVYPDTEKGDYRQPVMSPGILEMAVQVPSGQMGAVPESIQEEFRNDNPELYFLVYRDVNYGKHDNGERNLALHPLVFPDYDPRNLSTMDERVRLKNVEYKDDGGKHVVEIGPSVKAAVGMVAPNGIMPTRNIPEDKFHENEVFIHNCRFSPRNMQFRLEEGKDVCSTYFAARFRGRAVVFHVLVLRDDQQPGGRILRQALDNQQNLQSFGDMLGNEEYADDVRRTLGILSRHDADDL